MGTSHPDGGYSASVSAWLEIGGPTPDSIVVLGLSRTNGQQVGTITPVAIVPGTEANLIVSVDGVEDCRRIRIKGGVLWEYETLSEEPISSATGGEGER